MRLRQSFNLICFDVDGTLIKHPSGKTIWEVLNNRYGGSDERNRERYLRFKAGEITYPQWVELDVSGWIERGATRRDIVETTGEFSLTQGAYDTVHELKRRGYKLCVISGTLDVLLDTLFPDHPFDDVYTNRLYFDDDDRLSGWQATPYDNHGKPVALRQLSEKHAIPLERTAYVGDGENDVPLLGTAGYFVAYQPRSPKLEAGADIVIRDDGLHPLLDLFNRNNRK